MGIRQPTQQPTLMSAATDRRILTLLVRARMSLRRQRRDNSFYHRLAETGRNPRVALESDLAALLPPRREWPRPGTAARNAARTNGLDAVSIALVDWLLSNFATPRRSSPPWLKRLRKFVAPSGSEFAIGDRSRSSRAQRCLPCLRIVPPTQARQIPSEVSRSTV